MSLSSMNTFKEGVLWVVPDPKKHLEQPKVHQLQFNEYLRRRGFIGSSRCEKTSGTTRGSFGNEAMGRRSYFRHVKYSDNIRSRILKVIDENHLQEHVRNIGEANGFDALTIYASEDVIKLITNVEGVKRVIPDVEFVHQLFSVSLK